MKRKLFSTTLRVYCIKNLAKTKNNLLVYKVPNKTLFENHGYIRKTNLDKIRSRSSPPSHNLIRK
jgi:hypothetical protein